MTKSKLLSVVAVAGLALAGIGLNAGPALAEPPADKTKEATTGDKAAKPTAAAAGAKVGDMAPAFTLTDTDGKTHNLADYKGRVVVLEWFNPECPFIVKHHKTNLTFNDLHTQYTSKNVVFLAINSSAKGKQGHGKDLNVTRKEEFKMAFPILMDEDGAIGRAYGAKTTPHCYVIDTTGKVAYNGAIDNDDSVAKAGDKNYVKAALDEVLAGKPVTDSSKRPYGCSVKYAGK